MYICIYIYNVCVGVFIFYKNTIFKYICVCVGQLLYNYMYTCVR